MIRDIEIKEMAREYGIPETTIEKDYALNWILKSLYQQTDSFALKGGTGLRKIYFKKYRFSEDLDFTMLRSAGRSEIEGYTFPHSPISDSLISFSPPAQYKTIDGAPGIDDGAGISKQVYDKYDEIIYGGA